MAAFTARAVKLVAISGAAIPVIGLNGRLSALSGDEDKPKYIRACDIPMYPVSNKVNPEEVQQKSESNVVKDQISTVRKVAGDLLTDVLGAEFTKSIQDTYDNVKSKAEIGIEHSKTTLDFVQTNPGELPRVAFISVASMGGMVAGYRGGILKKVVYASIAGLSAAALCYPHFTVDLSKAVTEDAKVMWKDNIGWPLTDNPESNKLMKKKTPVKTTYDGTGDPGQSDEADRDLYSTRSS